MAETRCSENLCDGSVIIVDDENIQSSRRRSNRHSRSKLVNKRKHSVIPNHFKSIKRRRSARIRAKELAENINVLNVSKQSALNKQNSKSSSSYVHWNKALKSVHTPKSKISNIIIIDDDEDVITIDDDDDCMEVNKLFSNMYSVEPIKKEGLREIVIDGSSVALTYSGNTLFSVEGLKLVIDYFLERGHKVKAFVPHFRLKLRQSSNQKLLNTLINKNYVVTTPSRSVKGKLITCNDGRYIIQYATHCHGIIVSNDDFRDIINENLDWHKIIQTRLLVPKWRNNKLIFNDIPFGRYGQSLEEFLKFP